MTKARLARLVLALLIAVGGLAGALPALPDLPAGPPTVRAADGPPSLTIVANARYDVQPAQHRVRVTLDLTLSNRLRDTTTKRYFFDHAFLAVLPSATGYQASWAGSGRPSDERGRRERGRSGAGGHRRRCRGWQRDDAGRLELGSSCWRKRRWRRGSG